MDRETRGGLRPRSRVYAVLGRPEAACAREVAEARALATTLTDAEDKQVLTADLDDLDDLDELGG